MDLTGDEDPTDKDGDTRMDYSIGVSTSLGGEISSGEKKFQESNSDNIEGTTVYEAIEACSGGIGNTYACMTSIYGSSCKGEKTVQGSRNIVGKVGGKSVLNFESRMVGRGHRVVNNPAEPEEPSSLQHAPPISNLDPSSLIALQTIDLSRP
uniref:Uncharacterized protein n=1 Tax=Tanacetum cinerariifolium TaxID=118510 RepID=A0A699H030_TANCI|nr:hypothetical protein [Tanacetum cinerariifolium]